jgi:hypothetical protein
MIHNCGVVVGAHWCDAVLRRRKRAKQRRCAPVTGRSTYWLWPHVGIAAAAHKTSCVVLVLPVTG